jgi:hypothetical protein
LLHRFVRSLVQRIWSGYRGHRSTDCTYHIAARRIGFSPRIGTSRIPHRRQKTASGGCIAMQRGLLQTSRPRIQFGLGAGPTSNRMKKRKTPTISHTPKTTAVTTIMMAKKKTLTMK